MFRIPFADGWTVTEKIGAFESRSRGAVTRTVTLPHDAIRDLERRPDSDQGVHTGYFPGGVFVYAKEFSVPRGWADRSVFLAFEGVYRDAVVTVNGEFVAHHAGGYSEFTLALDAYLRFGETNRVTVEARAHKDSRWYTGAGIYRPVHLVVANPVHIALDGVAVRTVDLDAERAIVEVSTVVRNRRRHTSTARVTWTIHGPEGAPVAVGTSPVTTLPGEEAVARCRLAVDAPEPWHPDSPALYEVRTALAVAGDDGALLDEDATRFGIRRLQVDTRHGLRINGASVLLRGACVHHDSGLLGAATFAAAEDRRIRILKEAGFNALRSAHNPISRAMLDACDRHGVLVMDELSDVWTRSKTAFDASLSFPETWRDEIASMVSKDRNHPSVVMYSIGNEILELGTPIGSTWSRRLAEGVRALDDTRFVTNGLNGLIANFERLHEVDGVARDESADPNTLMATMGDRMARVNASPLVSETTEESAAVLDVVGFNYSESRYELDAALFPNRVVVGSETFPQRIAAMWELVEGLPHVVGDFTWTGWDYLGEAGIGRVDDTTVDGYAQTGTTGPYPHLLAGSGDIDITGLRRPVSFYREIVFGLRREPFIAVHRPSLHGRALVGTPWSWDDVVSTWTWDAEPGAPVTVDVYADADSVELLLDGETVGVAAVGEVRAFTARFEIGFGAGELIAVAYRDGAETGRTALRPAARDALQLTTTPEQARIGVGVDDLAFVPITIADVHGTVVADADRRVEVTIDGPAVLVGLGTGRIRTEEPFGAAACTTYDGRALAIVRPTGTGRIEITVRADGLDAVTAVVDAG